MAETQSFHLLDKRVQNWIWKQGWTSLLEIQENTIPHVIKGNCDIIVSAPTGGGKTEAVFLPIISKLLQTPFPSSYSILYLSPLKALINDQFRRLTDICGDLGIPVTPWHGDVSNTMKNSSFQQPRGILILTPESLESVLMHRNDRLKAAFSSLQFIVIDEIHSFVGKERGKQIQSLLCRVDHIVGKHTPRIGMSATLSDFEDIKAFIRQDGSLPCVVPEAGEQSHEIQALIKEFVDQDYQNGTKAIAEDLFIRLRGSNNLIFTQSRAAAEDYMVLLNNISQREGVPNEFRIHHSSIDKEDRHLIEQQLQSGKKPTSVVCTSTLELGIDVGTVKSIAQIGTCPSVSSLRQRLGRSGRRNAPSILRIYNQDTPDELDLLKCLSFGLVHNIALVELIKEKKFEPYNINRYHFSTLVQQILSTLTQYGSFYPKEGWTLLCKNGAFRNIPPELFLDVLRSLGEHSIITQTNSGQIIIGDTGERIVSKLDFYAAFTAPKEVQVVEKESGKHIGTINVSPEVGQAFVLSGRSWIVKGRERNGDLVFVEEVQMDGVFHFSSSYIDVDRIIVQKMRDIYYEKEIYPYLDAPAKTRLQLARETFRKMGLLQNDAVILTEEDENGNVTENILFFTWAGTKINRTICLSAEYLGLCECAERDFYIEGVTVETMRAILKAGDINPIKLATLVDRSFKIKEKYDRYLSDELLDFEYAKGMVDVPGMINYLYTILPS